MIKASQFGPVTRIDLARTIAGRGRYWTTAYLIDGLLIDSGCAYTAPELVVFVQDKPLKFILNTHTHEDHIGANGHLQRGRPDIAILAHPLALPVLADPRGRQPLQPYRRIMWGWPEPSKGKQVEDGEAMRTDRFNFQVIFTPGHSPDHICLYEPDQGWLFSGDLFVGGQDRALGVHNDIWPVIDSLKKVAELPLKQMFPGCARVRENPKDELHEKINYLEEMGEKAVELGQKGWSVAAIARTLFGKTMFIEIFTLGHFSRRNLVKSYLSRVKLEH